jgi:hypothetical protein
MPIVRDGRSYVITHSQWDRKRASVLVVYEDDNGSQHVAEAQDMSDAAKKQAVINDILAKA